LTDEPRQFVARDATTAVERAAEPTGALSLDGERVAGELAAFLEVAEEGYAICICSSPLVRDRILQTVRRRIKAKGVGVLELELAAGERSITAAIRRALATPEFAALEKESSRVAVSVNNLADAITKEEWESDARPEPIQGLNQQRDWVRKLGRPVLFWMSDWLAARLPTLAPDFWVGRSVVFEFRTEPEFRSAALSELRGDWTGFSSPEEARRKVRIYEELARDEKQPEQRAIHLANLGELLTSMAQFRSAEEVLKQALALLVESHGEQHPSMGKVLSGLGLLTRELGRYREAEDYLSRALSVEEATGKDDTRLAAALNNLALLLQDTNRLADAEPLMRRALALDEKSYGPEHPEVATDLNNLAQLLRATNRLAEAEPLMRRVVTIMEKSYGPEHPDVATALNNLAQLLQATNRLAEAEPLMRRALAIDEKSYGPEHPNVARDLNNLAQLLKATNRLAEAEPLMRRALAIDEKSYRPDYPNVAIQLNNLALLLQDTNRLAEAEPLMRRVMEIVLKFTQATGHPHPHLEAASANYAGLLQAMGRSEDQIRQTLAELAAEYGLKPD
jgi:tetratricopeptide (TPR) repeat protein